MAVVEFDEGDILSRKNRPQNISSITAFIINKSFGLIKTKKEAELIQVIFFCAMLALFLFQVFFQKDGNKIQNPSSELINSDQSFITK